MRRFAAALFSIALLTPAASAQFGLPAGEDPKASIDGSVQKRTADQIEGTIMATIAEGWHVNSNQPNEDFSIPTVLTLSAPAELIEASYPAHKMMKFEFSGENPLAVYDGTFAIPFRARLKEGTANFEAKLRYQACSDRVCLPPAEATVVVDATTLRDAPAATKSAGTSAPPASAGGGFTPLSAAPSEGTSSLFSSDVGGTLASRGLPLTLVAIFVLGLALNLTPCVYPLIPITIGYFSQQSGSSTSRRVALSSLYVLGLAITYSALGVFSALSGKLFGAWLQHPAVLIFFAALMLVMASSMFGLFEITVPQFIANRSGGQSGLAGALTMGLLIGIVAAPCVGPFVISLIALVSSLQSPLLGFLMFFVLALGLGVPYLLLGIFSSSANALPRSGEWMVQVKKAMGFILIAMAFYFVRPLIGDLAFQYGVAASLLIGALFLFVSKTQGARVWRIGIASMLLISGVAFAIPRSHDTLVSWTPYDQSLIAEARAQGKPVVIDFYADWCLPCKELDEKTFSDPRVAAALENFVRVKADLTLPEDETTQRLTKEYSVVGVPTIVFLDESGQEISPARLTGFEEADQFLKRVERIP
jgi:thiol:disulfide interchange protein DsbD